MKKLFFIAFVLIVTNTFAQTEKGDWLVGGTAGFQTTTGNSNVTFSPDLGYFIKHNFAVGADVGFSSNKLGTQTDTEFDFGPFARYYFGHSNFRPFTMLKLSYLNSSVKDSDFPNLNLSQDGFGYTLGLGGAAFFSPDVAFEGILGYNYSQYATAEKNKGISLSLGFQVYINSRKMKSLKRLRLND